METLNLDLNKRYTYADYLTWADDVRRELYDGFIKLMSPSPSSVHQRILRKFVKKIDNFLTGKKCELFFSPSDVRFPKEKINTDDRQTFTVVQPDLFIVCDPAKIDIKGCFGAPDFIIEIVSPKNSKRDVKDKFKIYEENGVREYWLVHPNDETVFVYFLYENNKYQQIGIYAEDDKIPVNIFNGELEIDLTEIF